MCIVPKSFHPRHKGYIELSELEGQNFVSQRESTDADIQMLLQKHQTTIHSSCHVVDDSSMIAMVAAGLGICIMPSLVMKNMPYDVDMYSLRPTEKRIIGICALNPELMAPAVKSMYKHIQKYFQK